MAKKRTAKHWHIMHELLYSMTQSTQNPQDLGSRIDTPLQNVGNDCIGQLSGWVQVGRAHKVMMGRIVVLDGVVTKVSASGFPINEKLAFPGAVLDPIEWHVDGFGYFCLIVPLTKSSAVELSTQIGVSGCGCPSYVRIVRIGTAS